MQHSYLLAGISSGKLFRLIARNGLSLRPKYLFRTLFLLQGSFFASVFNRLEKFKLGNKLKEYSMPDDPVFIIGHWRTGTTLLHQLMALDDQFVTPSVFHVSTPESFLISEKFYRPVMSSAMKSTRPMDNVKLDFDQPQEEEYALIKMTADSPLEKLIFPIDEQYFLSGMSDFKTTDEKKWRAALENFCLRLSYINKKRVLLKNPFHSMRIPILLNLYPNAKFIHMHRNPLEVIPSTIHMWQIVGEENKLKGKPSKLKVEEVTSVYNTMLSRINEDLKSVAENAKIEVAFEDLEKNPAAVLKSIYHKLGLDYAAGYETVVNEWVLGMKSYKKNSYSLSENEKETIQKILGKQNIYYNYKQ